MRLTAQQSLGLSDLTGKVAVVTGAGSGIGLGTAARLGEAGADLFLHYRTPRPQMDALVERLRKEGRRVETKSADFGDDPGAAAAVVEEAVSRLGQVDILVNNAAVVKKRETLLNHDRHLFEEMMAVNVTSVFLALQAAAKHMVERGKGGRIINLSSVHSVTTSPDLIAYATSKGAISTMTYSAAVTLGQYGITVNAIGPGAIWVEHFAENTVMDRGFQVTRIPMGRFGRPDDIAATVVFLASDAAEYITGQVIFVDGGMMRRLPFLK
ncbi:MAG: SDR family NAD(P)-dependent oxidoreductase [Chloroflexota bacterium]